MTQATLRQAAPWHALGSARLQALAALLALAVLVAFGWRDDGLWFLGDAPRHLLTGVFIADLLRAWPADPLAYALGYYARYPVIVPLVYPPGFHLLEGLAFLVLPVSPWVGKGLVVLATAAMALYAGLWARRWLAPQAGWAAALLVTMPGVMRYGNGVLLNMPAAALGLALLYHVRRWLDTASRGHLAAAIGLAVACVLTYYPALLSVVVALVWALPARRWRLLLGWAALLLVPVIGLALLPGELAPAHLLRNLPALGKLRDAQAWLFYPRALVELAGWPLAALAAIGLVAGLRSERWRSEARQLLLGLLVVVACLLPLPPVDVRYALPALPLLVLAAMIGPLVWSARRPHSANWTWAVPAALVPALALQSFLGPRPAAIVGHDQVAAYLAAHGRADGVLYAGGQEANLGVYLRAGDPTLQARLVLASQLLWAAEAGPGFERKMRPLVDGPQAMLDRIRSHCGCRWVAWEVRTDSKLLPGEQQLRQLLESPAFEPVASFALRSPGSPRLDLFRARFEPGPVPARDLRFPFFTDRVFPAVLPLGLPPP